MRMTPKALWLRAMSRMILIGLFAWSILLEGAGSSAATDAALQVSPATYDFGAVQRLSGQVQTTVAVRNQGDAPLIIQRIWTS